MLSVSNSSGLYPQIRALLGDRWIETSIEEFYKKRLKISEKNVYNPQIETLEKRTHPIIRDILSHLKIDQEKADLVDLPNKCKAHLNLILLDRDIGILKRELFQNSAILSDYRNNLSLTKSYDQTRFEIFVAANYKLSGFGVSFVARNSKEQKRTHEFNVEGNGIQNYLQVECKQRYQREPDYQREKFLYLLTENLFPRLFSFKISNVEIEIDWRGNTVFGDIKPLADNIVGKTIGVTGQVRYEFKGYEITIRHYKTPLFNFLKSFQRDVPNYVTTEDAFLATHKSVFLILNRNFDNTVKKVRSLYGSAKGQFDTQNDRLVYIDIGTLPISVIEDLEKSFRLRPPTGVGILFILKSQLHVNGRREIVFTPNTQVIWNRKLIKPFSGFTQIPGFIGESGFDSYIRAVL